MRKKRKEMNVIDRGRDDSADGTAMMPRTWEVARLDARTAHVLLHFLTQVVRGNWNAPSTLRWSAESLSGNSRHRFPITFRPLRTHTHTHTFTCTLMLPCVSGCLCVCVCVCVCVCFSIASGLVSWCCCPCSVSGGLTVWRFNYLELEVWLSRYLSAFCFCFFVFCCCFFFTAVCRLRRVDAIEVHLTIHWQQSRIGSASNSIPCLTGRLRGNERIPSSILPTGCSAWQE